MKDFLKQKEICIYQTKVLSHADHVQILYKREVLENYLLKIEFVSFQSDFFRTPGLTIYDLSNKIIIPSSHLIYVFKYHSSGSFNDFKKIIRIQDSIKLLKSGFLNTNTIEALSLKVGFSSYTPFFNSFKSITNMAPLEFYKSV